jgi:hypothetical protein
MTRKITLAFALLLLAVYPSIAVTPDSIAKPISNPVSQVLGVYTQKTEETNPTHNGEAFAGDVIKVKISNPGQFLSTKPTDQSKLLLYIDGLPFILINTPKLMRQAAHILPQCLFRLCCCGTSKQRKCGITCTVTLTGGPVK